MPLKRSYVRNPWHNFLPRCHCALISVKFIQKRRIPKRTRRNMRTGDVKTVFVCFQLCSFVTGRFSRCSSCQSYHALPSPLPKPNHRVTIHSLGLRLEAATRLRLRRTVLEPNRPRGSRGFGLPRKTFEAFTPKTKRRNTMLGEHRESGIPSTCRAPAGGLHLSIAHGHLLPTRANPSPTGKSPGYVFGLRPPRRGSSERSRTLGGGRYTLHVSIHWAGFQGSYAVLFQSHGVCLGYGCVAPVGRADFAVADFGARTTQKGRAGKDTRSHVKYGVVLRYFESHPGAVDVTGASRLPAEGDCWHKRSCSEASWSNSCVS